MLKLNLKKNTFDKIDEQTERNRLSILTETELLIEIIIELKKINNKCDDMARKIVIYGN